MTREIGMLAAHRDLVAGSMVGQRELHEHVGAAVEPECSELDDGALTRHRG
jgi:hypothetical protein